MEAPRYCTALWINIATLCIMYDIIYWLTIQQCKRCKCNSTSKIVYHSELFAFSIKQSSTAQLCSLSLPPSITWNLNTIYSECLPSLNMIHPDLALQEGTVVIYSSTVVHNTLTVHTDINIFLLRARLTPVVVVGLRGWTGKKVTRLRRKVTGCRKKEWPRSSCQLSRTRVLLCWLTG